MLRILAFDTLQIMHQTILEVEEPEVSRTQELLLSVPHYILKIYIKLRCQEYNFSPPGTTFEREDWAVLAEGVTHLQLWMKPDKGDKSCRATLTSLVLKSAEH